MSKSNNENFEDALVKLEKIVEKLEKEDVELEKSIELFEQGINLCSFCKKKLKKAEGKIKILTEKMNKELSMEEIDLELS